MDRLIFKVFNTCLDKHIYIGNSLLDDTKEIICKGDLRLNKTYVVLGKREGDTFKVKSAFPYEEIKGQATDIMVWDKNIKQLTVKSQTGQTITMLTDSIKTEKNVDLVFKGYFGKEKKIFYALSVHPIEVIPVKISSAPKRCPFDYTLKEAKVKIQDGYKNSIKYNQFKIRGVIELIYQNDEVVLDGYFEETKYGNCFIVTNYQKDVSSSEQMLEAYISKQIPQKYLQKRAVKRVIEHFGTDTLTILENETERLKEILPKIKDEKIEYIKKKLNASKFIQDLYFFCEKENIDARIATKIYAKFGLASITTLINNPYELAEIDNSLFREADILAMNKGFTYNNTNRVREAVKLFLKTDAKNNGNVYTNIDTLYDELNTFLNIYGAFDVNLNNISPNEIKAAIAEEIKIDEVVQEDNRLYLKYNYFYESFVARKIRDMLSDFKNPFTTPQELEEEINNFSKKFNLAENQRKAVKNAIFNNISILTGGPGTGKTLTVRAILSAIKNLKKDAKYKLCAPTGRAAQRLAEVTMEQASTIHKLLNMTTFSSTLEENDQAYENLKGLDFLIIDEFSMVDLELFYKILFYLDEKTRLIIVGDYNQLPSVSEGQLLKDLIDSKIVPTVRLTEIFRQGKESEIIEVSSLINNKKPVDINKYIKTADNFFDSDFSFIKANTLDEIDINIMKILNDLTSSGKSFESIQILNPTNKGEIGTIKLNEDIQKSFNKNTDYKAINTATIYKKGDKVIHIVNNYDLGVMNGSIGFVDELYEDANPDLNVLSVDYDGKKVVYTLKDIDQIKLAYSITIHKSQGSEFPIVIIPIHKSNEKFLNMNLLYTAITRARNYVIIIGDEESFRKGLKKSEINRNSALIEKISK